MNNFLSVVDPLGWMLPVPDKPGWCPYQKPEPRKKYYIYGVKYGLVQHSQWFNWQKTMVTEVVALSEDDVWNQIKANYPGCAFCIRVISDVGPAE